ncbi:SUMF1/EgtB/PvdO family nonheme iron enzyme [Ulvibacterium sp.]|uniref:SUMF1/EgtB/PvdO family nonheme iron enzyme n=1 Tax=Ulvibacterium sp. TaxID=2665914 RepID=UPI003BA8C71C
MKYITVLIGMGLSFFAKASDLTVSRPILYMEGNTAYTIFNVGWDNAWNNGKNNDAVWLFFKLIPREGGYRHIQVMDDGHTTVSTFSDDLDLGFEVPTDGTGLFLFPKNSFRGKVEATVKVILDPKSLENVNTRNSSFATLGIEMVHIPKGGFELGDPSSKALDFGSFYKPDEKGNVAGPVSVASENQEFEVSETGDIHYRVSEEGYEGDQKGVIPSTYPKGVSSFYIMKYEPNEGQYANFLNSLDQNQIVNRLIFDESDYYTQGGTITQEKSRYSSKYPNKPCMFMGWDDAMAYADWAGLRPMTEFEYTKATRGTGTPTAGELPWGSSNKEKMQRLPDPNGVLAMLNGWDESRLTEANKAYFGASYYWVMDMAGSLWERVITVGHPMGRSYTGSHGDGLLSSNGNATNKDWPTGEETSGGIGFRGGGFYGYDREYHEFNPFSPIAYRPYGGWQGGMRNNSYGARFVRSGSR